MVKTKEETKIEPGTSIFKRLLEAQKNYKAAIKDEKNPFFKSSYADLGGVWEACRDALHDNGLFVSQQLNLKQIEGGSYVNTLVTKIFDENGEFISSEMAIQQKEANNMQALGSGITYARRYALAAILGIITEDDDGNAASGKNVQTYKSAPVSYVEPKKDSVDANLDRPVLGGITYPQQGKIRAMYAEKKLNGDAMKLLLKERFGVNSHKEMTSKQASEWIEFLGTIKSIIPGTTERDMDKEFLDSLDGQVEGQ